jgi:hypothetical protein
MAVGTDTFIIGKGATPVCGGGMEMALVAEGGSQSFVHPADNIKSTLVLCCPIICAHHVSNNSRGPSFSISSLVNRS